MNIILPMAGRGSRFVEKGFTIPKPLINVEGKPMFAWALETIKDLSYDKLIVISLKEHKEYFKAEEVIKQYAPANTEIIFLDDVTEGQLCTVLAAKDHINNDNDLLIISADTIVKSDLHKQLLSEETQGMISVANLPGDRWSFAAVDENGKVTQVAEKVRISDHASTGIYYFKKGKDFVHIAENMICNQEKTKGEYYVIPVYQKLINLGLKVTISQAKEIWDLGTPASLEEFLIHYRSSKEMA
jgi:dTDP-glucose pyrophosphorylase